MPGSSLEQAVMMGITPLNITSPTMNMQQMAQIENANAQIRLRRQQLAQQAAAAQARAAALANAAPTQKQLYDEQKAYYQALKAQHDYEVATGKAKAADSLEMNDKNSGIFIDPDTGQPVRVYGSTEKERQTNYEQDRLRKRQKKLQDAINDGAFKSLEPVMTNQLDIESGNKALADFRRNEAPVIAERYGLTPEEVLNSTQFKTAANNLQELQREYDNESNLGLLGKTAKYALGEFGRGMQMIPAIVTGDDESKQNLAKRSLEAHQRLYEGSAFLTNQAKRAAAGQGALERATPMSVFTTAMENAPDLAALIAAGALTYATGGTAAPAAAAQVANIASKVGMAARIGRGLRTAASAANRAKIIAGTGAVTMGGRLPLNTAMQIQADENKTEEQKRAEIGNIGVGSLAAGAGLGALTALPVAHPLGGMASQAAARRGIALPLGSHAAEAAVRRQIARGAITDAAVPAVERGAVDAATAAATDTAANAAVNIGGRAVAKGAVERSLEEAIAKDTVGRANQSFVRRYLTQGLPAAATEGSLIMAANQVGMNYFYNQATGSNVPLTQGVGEAVEDALVSAPVYGLLMARNTTRPTPEQIDIVNRLNGTGDSAFRQALAGAPGTNATKNAVVQTMRDANMSDADIRRDLNAVSVKNLRRVRELVNKENLTPEETTELQNLADGIINSKANGLVDRSVLNALTRYRGMANADNTNGGPTPPPGGGANASGAAAGAASQNVAGRGTRGSVVGNQAPAEGASETSVLPRPQRATGNTRKALQAYVNDENNKISKKTRSAYDKFVELLGKLDKKENLSDAEKEEYVNAVRALQAAPELAKLTVKVGGKKGKNTASENTASENTATVGELLGKIISNYDKNKKAQEKSRAKKAAQEKAAAAPVERPGRPAEERAKDLNGLKTTVQNERNTHSFATQFLHDISAEDYTYLHYFLRKPSNPPSPHALKIAQDWHNRLDADHRAMVDEYLRSDRREFANENSPIVYREFANELKNEGRDHFLRVLKDNSDNAYYQAGKEWYDGLRDIDKQSVDYIANHRDMGTYSGEFTPNTTYYTDALGKTAYDLKHEDGSKKWMATLDKADKDLVDSFADRYSKEHPELVENREKADFANERKAIKQIEELRDVKEAASKAKKETLQKFFGDGTSLFEQITRYSSNRSIRRYKEANRLETAYLNSVLQDRYEALKKSPYWKRTTQQVRDEIESKLAEVSRYNETTGKGIIKRYNSVRARNVVKRYTKTGNYSPAAIEAMRKLAKDVEDKKVTLTPQTKAMLDYYMAVVKDAKKAIKPWGDEVVKYTEQSMAANPDEARSAIGLYQHQFFDDLPKETRDKVKALAEYALKNNIGVTMIEDGDASTLQRPFNALYRKAESRQLKNGRPLSNFEERLMYNYARIIRRASDYANLDRETKVKVQRIIDDYGVLRLSDEEVKSLLNERLDARDRNILRRRAEGERTTALTQKEAKEVSDAVEAAIRNAIQRQKANGIKGKDIQFNELDVELPYLTVEQVLYLARTPDLWPGVLGENSKEMGELRRKLLSGMWENAVNKENIAGTLEELEKDAPGQTTNQSAKQSNIIDSGTLGESFKSALENYDKLAYKKGKKKNRAQVTWSKLSDKELLNLYDATSDLLDRFNDYNIGDDQKVSYNGQNISRGGLQRRLAGIEKHINNSDARKDIRGDLYKKQMRYDPEMIRKYYTTPELQSESDRKLSDKEKKERMEKLIALAKRQGEIADDILSMFKQGVKEDSIPESRPAKQRSAPERTGIARGEKNARQSNNGEEGDFVVKEKPLDLSKLGEVINVDSPEEIAARNRQERATPQTSPTPREGEAGVPPRRTENSAILPEGGDNTLAPEVLQSVTPRKGERSEAQKEASRKNGANRTASPETLKTNYAKANFNQSKGAKGNGEDKHDIAKMEKYDEVKKLYDAANELLNAKDKDGKYVLPGNNGKQQISYTARNGKTYSYEVSRQGVKQRMDQAAKRMRQLATVRDEADIAGRQAPTTEERRQPVNTLRETRNNDVWGENEERLGNGSENGTESAPGVREGRPENAPGPTTPEPTPEPTLDQLRSDFNKRKTNKDKTAAIELASRIKSHPDFETLAPQTRSMIDRFAAMKEGGAEELKKKIEGPLDKAVDDVTPKPENGETPVEIQHQTDEQQVQPLTPENDASVGESPSVSDNNVRVELDGFTRNNLDGMTLDKFEDMVVEKDDGTTVIRISGTNYDNENLEFAAEDLPQKLQNLYAQHLLSDNDDVKFNDKALKDLINREPYWEDILNAMDEDPNLVHELDSETVADLNNSVDNDPESQVNYLGRRMNGDASSDVYQDLSDGMC